MKKINNLKKIIYELFNYEWQIVENLYTTWDVVDKDYTYNEYSYYEIFYSPVLNKYKLKISGFKPKATEMYQKAIQRLNELRNNIKND